MNFSNSLSIGPSISPISISLEALSFVPDCSRHLTEASGADMELARAKTRLACG